MQIQDKVMQQIYSFLAYFNIKIMGGLCTELSCPEDLTEHKLYHQIIFVKVTDIIVITLY